MPTPVVDRGKVPVCPRCIQRRNPHTGLPVHSPLAKVKAVQGPPISQDGRVRQLVWEVVCRRCGFETRLPEVRRTVCGHCRKPTDHPVPYSDGIGAPYTSMGKGANEQTAPIGIQPFTSFRPGG